MSIENLNIDNLVPKQIEKLISELNHALTTIKNRKQTVAKVAINEKEKIECPHCHSYLIVKNGHPNGIQNYKCKNCSKKFNALTGTIFASTHLTYNQIEIFFQCLLDRVSLRKTAKKWE